MATVLLAVTGGGCYLLEPSERLAEVQAIEVSGDGAKRLLVSYGIGACETFRSVTADEAPNRVAVAVTLNTTDEMCTMQLIVVRTTLDLALGTRPRHRRQHGGKAISVAAR